MPFVRSTFVIFLAFLVSLCSCLQEFKYSQMTRKGPRSFRDGFPFYGKNHLETENEFPPPFFQRQQQASSFSNGIPQPIRKRDPVTFSADTSYEITWKSCSDSIVTGAERSSGRFSCSMWLPTGSSITWSKGTIVLQNYTHHLYTDSSPTKMFFNSILFLDCISVEDQGQYRLDIQTGRRNYSKTFLLRVTTTGNSKADYCCKYSCGDYVRLNGYSLHIEGRVGEPLLVPCTFYGAVWRNEWFHEKDWNTPLQVGSSTYGVSGTNLLIEKLRREDEGYFVCVAFGAFNGPVSVPIFVEVLP